jgi:uncharacterized iron-regulated protein
VNSRLLVVGLVLLASGCARHHPPAASVEQPIAAGRTWISTKQRDHPLVGRIWDQRAGAFVDEAALEAALARADLVILGEVHDNPDVHVLQARVLRSMTAAGRRPALAFEMLDEDLQARIDRSLAEHPGDPDALARAVDWEHRGWYGFSMYRPIFAVGLGAGLPVVAANLPRTVAKDVAMRGRDALTPALATELARYEPLPPEVVRSLRAEMKASHCDAPLPEPFLDKLSLAQRARDAQMASRMLAAATSTGAVLVTGNGHARTDRGVPAYLAREARGRNVISVGIVEVSAGKSEPAQYAAEFGEGPLPLDYAIFTPVTDREDPCEGLRGHDWKMNKK